jgi:hypothetical protein
MSHMARSIPNLYRDAPVLSIIQRRKLAAMKKGSLTFAPIAGETLRLPSLSSSSVMDNNISNSSSTHHLRHVLCQGRSRSKLEEEEHKLIPEMVDQMSRGGVV